MVVFTIVNISDKGLARIEVTKNGHRYCVFSRRLECVALDREAMSMPMVSLSRTIADAVTKKINHSEDEVEDVVQMMKSLENQPNRLAVEREKGSVEVQLQPEIANHHLESCSWRPLQMDACRGNCFSMLPN